MRSCKMHTRLRSQQTHNHAAAANPEIRVSVTDVISGYIWDKEREEGAEQTN